MVHACCATIRGFPTKCLSGIFELVPNLLRNTFRHSKFRTPPPLVSGLFRVCTKACACGFIEGPMGQLAPVTQPVLCSHALRSALAPVLMDTPRLATRVCQIRRDQMEECPTEPRARRSTFLLSSGGAGGVPNFAVSSFACSNPLYGVVWCASRKGKHTSAQENQWCHRRLSVWKKNHSTCRIWSQVLVCSQCTYWRTDKEHSVVSIDTVPLFLQLAAVNGDTWCHTGCLRVCDIPSGCCSFTGPWTVTRSSLRMLRRVAAFWRPLRPVLLLVSFPHSRSPVVGVLGLC